MRPRQQRCRPRAVGSGGSHSTREQRGHPRRRRRLTPSRPPCGAALPPVDFEALFAQLPTSYMVMDRDLRFVAVNDAYLATTGRTREELIGTHV
ncbi:MAG: PAS domain-containing protein, partial [Actinomycetes bacterium]